MSGTQSRSGTIPGQQTLEFLTPAPRTDEPVHGDAPVAPVRLRFAAALTDALFVVSGVGFFFTTFHFMGGQFSSSHKAIYGYAGVVLALAVFYHLFWCVLRRETAGMSCFGLCLVDFDGRRPGTDKRVVRYLSACVGFLAAGIGVFWALVDQEKLAWHDQISKTFPTLRNVKAGTFHRR
jgi:uncharacterized RDD family membrane protein YckC